MGIAVQFLQIQMEKCALCKWCIHYDTENAYQATFQRNPGFNETEKGSYGPAKIKNITLKFNGDPNNALSELRNHSIDMLADVNQNILI